MRNVLLGAAGAAALLTLASCDTTSPVSAYSPSTPNVLAFQQSLKSDGKTVQVGSFTAVTGVEAPGCRMVGKLDVTSGKPIESYVKDALQSELFAAGVYDVKAPVTIMGKVDELKMNSMGTGSWTLGLQVTSTADPIGYHVTATRTYKTSFTGVVACQNATNAFMPTVQDLIAQVVSNPGFSKLVGKA